MDGIWWYTVIPEWDGMDIDSNLRCLSCPPFPSFLFSFSFRSCTTKSTANGWPKRRNFIWTMPRQLSCSQRMIWMRSQSGCFREQVWIKISGMNLSQTVKRCKMLTIGRPLIRISCLHQDIRAASQARTMLRIEQGRERRFSKIPQFFMPHTKKKSDSSVSFPALCPVQWLAKDVERKSDMSHERILLKNPCKPPVSKVSMPCITSSQAPRPCGQGPNDCWRGAIRGRNKNTMAKRFQCLKTCKVHKWISPIYIRSKAWHELYDIHQVFLHMLQIADGYKLGMCWQYFQRRFILNYRHVSMYAIKSISNFTF